MKTVKSFPRKVREIPNLFLPLADGTVVRDALTHPYLAGHGYACGRENYSILPDDPLSARQDCHWSMETLRGDWIVRTETYSSLSATKSHWLVSGRPEAYEGDSLVFAKDWSQKIKRKLV